MSASRCIGDTFIESHSFTGFTPYMHVLLKALGCRLNEAELENWSSSFQDRGHCIVDQPDQADLIVINTCAVTNEAVKKSRQLIRRSHRQNPNTKLVVSGCYSSLTPEIKNKIPSIDLLVPNQHKDNLVNIVINELAIETMPSIATQPGETALFQHNRTRAFVKIQDGCRYRCTFCIVTIARGNERSKLISDIVLQINKLADLRFKEVVLTGVHIGGYGADINTDLYSLIASVLTETDIPRLRLGSLESWGLPELFFDLFSNPRLMPHLHLPLQSGCDSVLKRMARRCRLEDFKETVQKARSMISDFNITTDAIVGFPGESDTEWQESMVFLENMGFSHIHIFPYSPRSGTAAAMMQNQITTQVKKNRSKQLRMLADKLKRAYLENHVSREFPVLFEGSHQCNETGNIKYSGYTPNFLRVQLDSRVKLTIENKIRNIATLAISHDGSSLQASLL